MRVRSAFTLVEIIIGITVLTIVLVAIGVLTLTSIRANTANVRLLTGYYLAQEALEELRFLRDSHWIQNVAWNDGFERDGNYRVEFVVGDLERPVVVMPTDGVVILYFEEGRYVHTSSEASDPSPYSRALKIKYGEEGRLEATAVVSWMDREVEKRVEVSTELTDWKEGPL